MIKNRLEKLESNLRTVGDSLGTSSDKQNLKDLIGQGWLATYAALFGNRFIEGLAPHHSEAIEWHWTSRIALLENKEPEFDAYFPIWSRAHNKSGIARRIAIMDGVLSYAYNQPVFILYLSRNKLMVKKHAKSVSSLLQSKRIKAICPEISEVQRNDQKQSMGWTEAFFYTKANVIFQFSGLDEGLAGGNLETNINEKSKDEDDEEQSDVRVTLVVPDDIDGREDSPTLAESRFNTLTTEVLPMGQDNTLVFFAQNLISRFSTMYRIYKQQARVLTGRKPTKPIPAVIDLKTEERTINGIIQDAYVSGIPTWQVWDAKRIQKEINRYGLESFLKECQHEVEQSKEGLMHKKYDDNVHPISYSQFATVFGSKDAWKRWYKVPASDWARTKTKYHANVAAYFCVSSQNTPLPGHTFVIPFAFKADTSPADVAVRLLSVLTPFAYQNRFNPQTGQYDSKTWEDLIDDAWKRTNSEHYFTTESQRIEFLKGYYTSLIAPHGARVLREHNVKSGVNSHSEDKVREMFNDGFGFDFAPANPRETDALEDIDEAQRVDYSLPHNFDPNKQGYTRWHLLCKDDFDAQPTIINGMAVYPPVPYPDITSPDGLYDEDLFRYQFCNRRFAPPQLTRTGEKIDVPEKLNDDFPQLTQFIYLKKLLDNIELTHQEIIEAQMSPEHAIEVVSQHFGTDGFGVMMAARQQEQRQIEMRMEEEQRIQDEQLRAAFGSSRRVRLLGKRR